MKWTIFILVLINIFFWYVVSRLWTSDTKTVNFSNKDKYFVFPTPKTDLVDPFAPTKTITPIPTTQVATDGSVIQY